MDSIYITIHRDKEIDCAKLCMDIQKLVYKELSHTNTDLVLSITLRNITNSDISMIPKITQKNP